MGKFNVAAGVIVTSLSVLSIRVESRASWKEEEVRDPVCKRERAIPLALPSRIQLFGFLRWDGSAVRLYIWSAERMI